MLLCRFLCEMKHCFIDFILKNNRKKVYFRNEFGIVFSNWHRFWRTSGIDSCNNLINNWSADCLRPLISLLPIVFVWISKALMSLDCCWSFPKMLFFFCNLSCFLNCRFNKLLKDFDLLLAGRFLISFSASFSFNDFFWCRAKMWFWILWLTTAAEASVTKTLPCNKHFWFQNHFLLLIWLLSPFD